MFVRRRRGGFSALIPFDSITTIDAIPNLDVPADPPDARPATGGYLGKRMLDVVAAVLMLLLFLPHLVMIAGMILVRSGRPVIFSHMRVGRHGRSFPCLKFRTMVPDAERALSRLLEQDAAARNQWRVARKLDRDPRIIEGIGSFLRRTSLDELPQILNVLRGEMSLVGPRPVTGEELADNYGRHRAAYQSVRPGLTGIWQISGRSDTSYAQRVELDRWYAANASLPVDLWILWRTTTGFLSGRLCGAR